MSVDIKVGDYFVVRCVGGSENWGFLTKFYKGFCYIRIDKLQTDASKIVYSYIGLPGSPSLSSGEARGGFERHSYVLENAISSGEIVHVDQREEVFSL